MQAADDFGRLAQIAPEQPLVHYNLGIALSKRGRIEDAIAAFKEARKLYQRQGMREGIEKTEAALRELQRRR